MSPIWGPCLGAKGREILFWKVEGVSWEGTIVVTLLLEAPQPLVGPALLTGLLSVGLASWSPEVGHGAPEERVSVTGGWEGRAHSLGRHGLQLVTIALNLQSWSTDKACSLARKKDQPAIGSWLRTQFPSDPDPGM